MPSHPTYLRSILILSSIYSLFFQVVSSLHVSPPKPCMPLSSPPYGPYAAPVSFFLVGWACGTYGTPDNFKYTSVPRYMPARTRPPIFRFYNSCLQTLCKIRIATLRRVAKPVPRQDNSTATKKGTHARTHASVALLGVRNHDPSALAA